MNSALAILAGLILVGGLIWAVVRLAARSSAEREKAERAAHIIEAQQQFAATRNLPRPPNRNERGARWRKLRERDASDT